MAHKEREWGTGWLAKRGRVWVACWKFNGRVYKRTTKTTNKREAEARLDEFTAPFKAAREGRHAEAVAEVVAAGEERARREMANLPALLMRDAYTVLEAVVGKSISAATLTDYRLYTASFCKWLNDNRAGGDGVEMRTVGVAAVKAYLKDKAANGATPQTRLLTAMKIKGLFQRIAEAEAERAADDSTLDRVLYAGQPWARLDTVPETGRWWNTKVNNWDECRPYNDEAVNAQHCGRKPLTRDELHRLLDTAKGSGELWLLLRIGAQTGLRLGDCANLRFADKAQLNAGRTVRLDEGRTGRVLVIPSKTGTRSKAFVDTALGDELHRIISALPNAGRGGEYLMPTLAGLYNHDASLLAAKVRKVFEAAGFETNVQIGSSPRRRAVYGFHSLRYTVAGVMASNGIGLDAAAGALAHANTRTTRGYVNGAKSEEQREAEAITWAAWFNGTDGAGDFASVTAGEVRREAVTDGQRPVYDAVCAMLQGLEPNTLKAVASEALRLAMANHAAAQRQAVEAAVAAVG